MQLSSLNWPMQPADTPTPRAQRWGMSRRGMILAAALPATGAIALGWPWLVAVGAAPLLLSAAPCLAMCALGLCLKCGSGKTCSIATPGSTPHLSEKDTTNA